MGSNFFLDNDDLRFHFENVVEWGEIADLAENGFKLPDGHANLEEAKEFYRNVVEAVGEYSADFIAPRAHLIDTQGIRLVDGQVEFGKALQEVFDGLKERELYGMATPRELGGSNCPMAVFFTAAEVIARADVSVMTHFGFHGAIALALMLYAAKEGAMKYGPEGVTSVRWESAIRELAAGTVCGAMDLTEPDAGSDLGRIRMRAVRRDAKWYLTGEKIFITAGYAQHHLVLAKTEEGSADDPNALKKLSLFLVPRRIERDGKTIENIRITKVEEKLGHHGSATCSLEFEESEGELVGQVNQGFELMLMLMNSARLGVGFEAVGLSEKAYRMAREFASQRKTMGQLIERHPVVAEFLMDMQLDIAAARALNYDAVNAVEVSTRLEMMLAVAPPKDPEQLRKLQRRLSSTKRRARLLTPLVKYMSSENAVRIARDGMQIHGGIGYISEMGADKLLRDSLVLTVYEGTSQIQALMSLKDNMTQALRKPALFAREAARARLMASTASGETHRLYYKAEASVYQSIMTILARVASDKLKRTVAEKGWSDVSDFVKMSTWDPKRDFAPALLHAERFAKAFSQVAAARILLDQADKFPERRKLADRYIRRMAPRVAALTDVVHSGAAEVFEFIAEL